MRLITLLLSLFVVLVMAVFVIFNSTPVEISFWPFDVKVVMPVSLMALAFLVIGFLMGGFLTLPRLWRGALEKRKLKNEIVKLNKEIEKKNPPVCAPSILMQGRYQTLPPEAPPKKSHWFWKGKNKHE